MTGILQLAFVSCWHEEARPNIPLEITVCSEDLGSVQVIRGPLFPLPLLPPLLPKATIHALLQVSRPAPQGPIEAHSLNNYQ